MGTLYAPPAAARRPPPQAGRALPPPTTTSARGPRGGLPRKRPAGHLREQLLRQPLLHRVPPHAAGDHGEEQREGDGRQGAAEPEAGVNEDDREAGDPEPDVPLHPDAGGPEALPAE